MIDGWELSERIADPLPAEELLDARWV